MIFSVNGFNKELNFNKIDVAELTIENPEMYFNITNDIIFQSNGGNGEYCSLREAEIDNLFQTKSEIIHNYYELTLNSKKILNYVQKEILKLGSSQDFIIDINNINCVLSNLTEKIEESIDIPIAFDNTYTLSDIVKFVKFAVYESDKLNERLIEYIELISRLCSINLIVLFNPNFILSSENLKTIINQSKYYGVKLLIVNSKMANIAVEDNIIIDKDLCEI